MRPTKVEDLNLVLGETTFLNLIMESSTEQMDQVVVHANVTDLSMVAIGPSSTYNYEDLQTLPAISRDIKDVIRTDPRLLIDETNADAIQCGGANNRYNSLTVDGIRKNDNQPLSKQKRQRANPYSGNIFNSKISCPADFSWLYSLQ